MGLSAFVLARSDAHALAWSSSYVWVVGAWASTHDTDGFTFGGTVGDAQVQVVLRRSLLFILAETVALSLAGCPLERKKASPLPLNICAMCHARFIFHEMRVEESANHSDNVECGLPRLQQQPITAAQHPNLSYSHTTKNGTPECMLKSIRTVPALLHSHKTRKPRRRQSARKPPFATSKQAGEKRRTLSRCKRHTLDSQLHALLWSGHQDASLFYNLRGQVPH